MVADLHAPSVARVHVTLFVASTPHVKPSPVALMNVSCGSSWSVTETLVAAVGPALLTVSVYVIVASASTTAGPVLVMETSACWVGRSRTWFAGTGTFCAPLCDTPAPAFSRLCCDDPLQSPASLESLSV